MNYKKQRLAEEARRIEQERLEKERLEKEKLIEENKLLRAKTENLQSMKRVEELYTEALNAMRNYAGQGEPDEY